MVLPMISLRVARRMPPRRGGPRQSRARGTVLSLLLLGAFRTLAAQESVIGHPIPLVEQLFTAGDFSVTKIEGARVRGDRTYHSWLRFEEGTRLEAKIAPAAPGADEFNNRPRYEIGAYEIQKLFLEPEGYVVPPTLARCLPLEFARAEIGEHIVPTFDGWSTVLVVLQYWLSGVEQNSRNVDEFLDTERFQSDDAYALHMANFNLLTYLIKHGDANAGNFFRATDPARPRVFTVDNGIALLSEESNRGTYWSELHVERLPRVSVQRLRALSEQDYHDALGVLVEFEVRDTGTTSVDPGENLDVEKGVRLSGTTLQLGLTHEEIRLVRQRAAALLKNVDEGRIGLFDAPDVEEDH